MNREPETFVALELALADYRPDSACAIAVVRVDRGVVTARQQRLIRPPRQAFVLSHLHGIMWDDVASAPPFRVVWRSLAPLLDGAAYAVARNAEATQGALRACCAAAGLAIPTLPFVCAGRLARATRTTIGPAPGAPRFHDPLTAAEEASRIALAARTEETRAAPRARTARPTLAETTAVAMACDEPAGADDPPAGPREHTGTGDDRISDSRGAARQM
jgi:DNA polymerase-3 subunit epsilon